MGYWIDTSHGNCSWLPCSVQTACRYTNSHEVIDQSGTNRQPYYLCNECYSLSLNVCLDVQLRNKDLSALHRSIEQCQNDDFHDSLPEWKHLGLARWLQFLLWIRELLRFPEWNSSHLCRVVKYFGAQTFSVWLRMYRSCELWGCVFDRLH